MNVFEENRNSRRCCYGLIALLTLALAGLLIATAIYGLRWGSDRRDARTINPINGYGLPGYPQVLDPYELYQKQMRQEAIYLFVTAGLIIIFALIVVAGFCCKVLSNRNRHILVAILLMLVFAVAVVLILRYVNNANLNDTPVNWYTHFNYKTNNWRDNFGNFNTYYKLVLAAWILAFALSLILLGLLCATLGDVSGNDILNPVVVEIPPNSNRNL